MVDMDMKYCQRMSKLKISDSKVVLRALPKLPTFCRDYFLLATKRDSSELFDMIKKKVIMFRKYHNHTLQTKPWRHKEEPQNINSNRTQER